MQVNNDLQAQQRFESFKLGTPASQATHAHARSHSRNTSMSSFSFGASKCTPANLADAPPPSSMRNSHHRRRSSVSTRHESAEMMGISVPERPLSMSEDNINLGDKDSIRRRALWALEGKPDASYSKVEIPELMTPETEISGFDFPTKPSFPAGSGASPGLMSSKRDSFKLLGPGISSKDQLDTLVEEDEDEEDAATTFTSSPLSITAAKPLCSKPRPATLSLRPLSLNPSANAFGLPTPPSASSSQSRTGLRSLSLCQPAIAVPRPALTLQISADGSLVKQQSQVDVKPSRRSSIAYKRSSSSSSLAGLPTPEMTPTLDKHRSMSTDDDDDDTGSISSRSSSRSQTRPLSVSEQHFLFKSHNALLTRIMDLERSLSSRRRDDGYNSRPTSAFSDVSNSSSTADDEMMRLVADLKAERDELKRDVEGWRERVADMDKQLVTFAKRVENERREAWVARTKCGMVEVERSSLSKEVESLNTQILGLRGETRMLQGEVDRLSLEKSALETEVRRLTVLQDDGAAQTPRAWQPFGRKRAVGFGSSLDSASTASVTDVDIDESPMEFGFSLKSVAEEPEEGPGYFSDDDNGLAGYEDEDDDDLDITNCPMSDDDFGSEDGFPRSVRMLSNPQSGLATPTQTPSHQSSASLSKTWTFPRGSHTRAIIPEPKEVDRFFGCLDDKEDSPVISADDEDPYSFEKSKGLFASGFKYESDNDMPAWLLGGVEEKGLDVVIEEEEDEEGSEMTKVDDDDVFGDIGGIKITFTPPCDDPVVLTPQLLTTPETPSPKTRCEPLPAFDDPFNFGRPFTQTVTPPASVPRRAASPSGIPRATNSYQTPPSKRPFTSFIPQPISPKPKPTATFIRQPSRMPAAFSAQVSDKSPNGSAHNPQTNMMYTTMNAIGRFSNDLSNKPTGDPPRGSSVMTSVDMGNREPSSECPKPSSSWSPRLLSSFTNYIALSLSPKMDDQVTPASPPMATFVTKEHQLHKLKVRLETEGESIVSFVADVCKKCHDGDAVFL